jgi:hypothetical protein
MKPSRHLWPLVALALIVLAVPGSASALNPPVLTSVGHVKYHPTATWTLPQWVEAWWVEVATKPDVASDGQFFEENRVVLDSVRTTDTSWTYESRLNPGTYYVHVRGWDNACLHNDFATECGVVTSNTLRLVLPPRPPRYAVTLRSVHVGAIRVPGSARVWTYHGDTLRATLRNTAATSSERRTYTLCYEQFDECADAVSSADPLLTRFGFACTDLGSDVEIDETSASLGSSAAGHSLDALLGSTSASDPRCPLVR